MISVLVPSDSCIRKKVSARTNTQPNMVTMPVLKSCSNEYRVCGCGCIATSAPCCSTTHARNEEGDMTVSPPCTAGAAAGASSPEAAATALEEFIDIDLGVGWANSVMQWSSVRGTKGVAYAGRRPFSRRGKCKMLFKML